MRVKKSVYWLVLSNLFFMALSMYFKWKLYDVLLVFWFETFMIGALTILKLKKTPLSSKLSLNSSNSLKENLSV